LATALIPGLTVDAASSSLKDKDFEAIATTGNGDCLFNAVSLASILELIIFVLNHLYP
jgi:hypothetical protein